MGKVVRSYKERLFNVLKGLGLASFTIACWGIFLAAVRTTNILELPSSDVATLLFGASSLFLFAVSFVLGLLGVVGYQEIKSSLNEAADRAAKVRVEDVQNELRGRTFATIGYITGEMSLLYENNTIAIRDRERLSEAIAVLQRAYDYLRLVGGPAEYMALNNLLFYSLLEDDKARSEFLLERAQALLKAGQEHNTANLILTACGVIVRYGVDERNRREAIEILEKFQANPRLSAKRRNEAKFYLTLAQAPSDHGDQPAPPKT